MNNTQAELALLAFAWIGAGSIGVWMSRFVDKVLSTGHSKDSLEPLDVVGGLVTFVLVFIFVVISAGIVIYKAAKIDPQASPDGDAPAGSAK